ncbi:MAG: mandelate racemase/muconate lactonizing enzyme family protein [Rhodobiaceae bacterium]|nr:mandelate racemase/muconate lactonizing enzyme family protein [Rhodobiaceae bacterium]MCC0015196.1 mandelate racemase/muconate lactonizing enzyme family protein [Rhodobiaceae bacterium]MCC0040736.1 mandelate racemase/muconate lactonizing enzyme family protein [Rhodobiaceae bacterium]MCC0053563.1 mandelate racemase/muconate lactonizing enzyme family protein [Rhodobiaceae bacterium]
MKITRISVWQMDLPLSKPYWLSGGRLKFESLDTTFVRIDTDEGISGWGEGCPWGTTYLPAHGPGVRAGIETLAPALLGRDPRSLRAINDVMDLQLPGHPYAKSALDIACWDILGKCSRLPLWQLFGGERPEPVAVNSSIATGTPDEMIALIREASAKGYRTHSAKIGGTNVAADIARIEAISAALPADEKVTFDVNRAWTPGVAVQVLNSVAVRDWIEQPCETLEQCAHVAARVNNPIMLDECLHTFGDHLDAWSKRACEGVKVKPNRVGGLTKALQIRDFGVSVGWQMHIEDLGGSALADTAAVHLASATPAANRLASWLCHYHLAVDPVPGQGARNIGGVATPPSEPGLGVTPDPDALGKPVAVHEA